MAGGCSDASFAIEIIAVDAVLTGPTAIFDLYFGKGREFWRCRHITDGHAKALVSLAADAAQGSAPTDTEIPPDNVSYHQNITDAGSLATTAAPGKS